MKRKIVLFATIILATLILFGSCSKDEDSTTPTTYTFKYSVAEVNSLVTTDVVLFEYNSKGEVIASNTMENCKKGMGKIYKPNTNSVKVKVYILVKLISNSKTIDSYWVKTIYYLTSGQNTNIELADNTIVTNFEP